MPVNPYRRGEHSLPPLAGKSTFGIQHYSTRLSFPLYTFPKTGHVHSVDKDPRADDPYDGKEYDPAGYNFGDGYSTNLGPRGKSADFTTGIPRGVHHLSQAPHRDGYPAPGFYGRNVHTTSFGRQVGLLRPQPCYSFGRGEKWNDRVYQDRELAKTGATLGAFSPGPNTVGRECFSSIGRQLNSRKLTSSKATIGQSKRFGALSSSAVGTPGPGSYDP